MSAPLKLHQNGGEVSLKYHLQVSPQMFYIVLVIEWLGHSMTSLWLCLVIVFQRHFLSSIVLAVCLKSLSCWKVNCCPSLGSPESLGRFSSKTSAICIWLHSSFLQFSTVSLLLRSPVVQKQFLDFCPKNQIIKPDNVASVLCPTKTWLTECYWDSPRAHTRGNSPFGFGEEWSLGRACRRHDVTQKVQSCCIHTWAHTVITRTLYYLNWIWIHYESKCAKFKRVWILSKAAVSTHCWQVQRQSLLGF